MNPTAERARELFVAALRRPPDGWDAYLDGACGADAELRRGVRELLDAHLAAGSFLERPALGLPATADLDAPGADTVVAPGPAEPPGTVVGPYTLLEVIAEGGMGTVYLAEQTRPVRRQVAVKVVKPGMDSRQMLARFEAERQALALMDHPNIAKVLDAGATEAGRPYFVMELVRGVAITRYCDERRLTPRQRLELFILVCRAVQHAHQKGVIHRDLKPSNVLVVACDGRPVPKVIDFGVAKAAGPPLTDATFATGVGMVVGTPEYMSPEQAELGNRDIDTRSDIYSLGAVLYELLTGTTPLTRDRLRGPSLLEALRLIREEEPPRPSTRLSAAEGLPGIAAARGVDPARLPKLLRGELDWVVMKCLEKDRGRRYESANDLAMDLQRFLADQPVEACPPSVGYRVRKFARRNRGAVLAAGLVLATLLAGVGASTALAFLAIQAERESRDKLFASLVNQARAERRSGQVGQRFNALDAIKEAARIRVTPDLRTEAAAALVLPDAEVAAEWVGWPEGTLELVFDDRFERFARLDSQGVVTVCRVNEGREEVLFHLPAPGEPAYCCLRISPDGRFVACGHSGKWDGEAGGVRVWQLDGPSPTVLVDVSEGAYQRAIAFHPDGRLLAIGHLDRTVSVYDLTTGRRVQRLTTDALPVHLAFHPREPRLAVACHDKTAIVFDTDAGVRVRTLPHPRPVTFIWCVAWHPDGRCLATGCNDRNIYFWDADAGTQFRSPCFHGESGLAVAFNRTGDRLVSVGWSNRARVWDVNTGRLLLSMPGRIGMRFSRDDDSLLGHSVGGNKVRLWRLADGRELRALRRRNAGPYEYIICPVAHANGRWVLAGSHRWLTFFDLDSGAELASVQLPGGSTGCPAYFDPSGGWVTAGSNGLFLWPTRPDPVRPDVLRVGPVRRLPAYPPTRSDAATANRDGRVVAILDGDRTRVVHRDRPDPPVTLGPQYDPRHCAVSPDGHWVVTCSHWRDGKSKSAWVLDVDTGAKVCELPMVGSTSARFSPDGRWLATSTEPSDVRLWEVGTWRQVRRNAFNNNASSCTAAFSPDSRLLAVNDVLGAVRLVETATDREVARLTGPDPWEMYGPVGFTPDGTKLITTCTGPIHLYVWNLRLIRQQLKELGLDWDWPEFPPASPESGTAVIRTIEILPGDLMKPVKPGSGKESE